MNVTMRYRIHPGTLRREQMLRRIAGANRFVYNWAIGENQDAMRAYNDGKGEKPSFRFETLCADFTALRNSEGFEWLKELPCSEVRYSLKYFTQAMKEAVQGKRGFPKRKYREDGDSFTIPSGVKIRDGMLYLTKVGWLPIKRRGIDRHAHGKPKQVRMKRECGKWYAYVVWEIPDVKPPDNGKAVGVDMNAGQVTTSDGEIHRGPDLRRLEARRKRYQRMVSRRKRVPVLDTDGNPKRNAKGEIIKRNSGRRERARRMLEKTSKRIANARRNWQHHTTSNLVARCGTVCIEDLSTKSMTKSAKGTKERPGRNVKAKSGLNRVILSTGWHAMGTMLDYKAHRVVRVPPQYTSQTCCRCGHAAAESRRTQAKFKCVSCGYAGNADVNAALNILALGTGATGRGAAIAAVESGPPAQIKQATAMIRSK